MILVEDTRQKKGQHNNISDYCKKHNITIEQKCLQVGDYMFPNGKIAVDTKANIDELAADLHKDRKVYGKKYKKGLKAKIRLVVLIEEPIKNFEELSKWRSIHSKMTGRYLVDLIDEVEYSYNIKFYFCDKKHTGEMIIKILEGKTK